jgi:hypothetical protein
MAHLMNVKNDFFRSIVIARETFEMLKLEGYPAALAKRLVLGVINGEEAEMRKQHRPFDDEAFIKRLKLLSAVPAGLMTYSN